MQFKSLITVTSTLLVALVQSTSFEGSYIVKIKGETRATLDSHIKTVESLFTGKSNENKIRSIYNELGSLYHATFTDEVLEKVKSMKDVAYVEADSEMKTMAVQSNAPWGLARLSQRSKLGSSLSYNYTADGSGVSVYVIDTGIFVDHPEFEGRARFGARFAGDDDTDEHGHGTHCAGTIGSNSYGVSKKVDLVAVKVFDGSGSGSTSGILSAINWTINDKKGKKGNVISMSLGGGKSQALNDAVKAAVNKDIVVVVAAGNENQDACRVSPASEPSAITVAAMDIRDARASFSNWGKCVDVFGPGVNILSTWNNGKTNSISGTSMATPHVAGLAAYFLSQKTESVEGITAKIINLASKSMITNPGKGTANLLAYNGVV